MNVKKNSIGNIIISLFFILLVFGAIGIAFVYYGGADVVKNIIDPTFRVRCNDEVYTADSSNLIILPCEGQIRFDVMGVSSYSVKVEPNADFNYTVSEQTFEFGSETYTKYFITSENVYDDCFVLDCDNDYSVEGVLSRVRGEAVEIPRDVHSSVVFKLVITSSVGKIEIPFWQNHDGISITLSSSTIVF